jgi:putative nucleotidyltransferase with HDIG domain
MKIHDTNQESKQGFEKTVKITEHVEVEIEDPNILEYIRKVGINNVYLVGGTVRDILTGKKPKDLDFVVTDFDKALNLAKEMNLPIHEDGIPFGVLRSGDKYDFASLRKEKYEVISKPTVELNVTLEEDAKRRDFTINDLYGKIVNIQENKLVMEILDFNNGLEDLRNHILRFVGNPQERIDEDPIRILRGIRFILYGYKMSTDQLEIMKKNVHKLDKLPIERIRDEILKILQVNPVEGFKLLDDFGLLKYLYGEHYQALVNIYHDYRGVHHGENVLEHTYEALKRLKNPDIVTILAVIYHDVGKPYTKSEKNGKIMFVGHANKSVEITKELMKRLKLPNSLIKDVTNLIEVHMNFNLAQNDEKNQARIITKLMSLYDWNPKKVREIYNKLIELSYADTGNEKILNMSDRITKPIVTGQEIINTFGISGDIVMHLKERAYTLQLLGYEKDKIMKMLKGDNKLYEYIKSLKNRS